jgi:hypothetical protein
METIYSLGPQLFFRLIRQLSSKTIQKKPFNIQKFQCRELYGFALKEAPETLENEYVKFKNSS